jgi:hypothetical protein
MTQQTRISIWAIVAGILVGVVPTLATDVVLHKIRVFPPWGQSMTGYESALLLATAYRTVYGVLGAYVTARLAPDRPMRHALWLGAIGLAVSIFGAAVTWNGGPPSGPTGIPSR